MAEQLKVNESVSIPLSEVELRASRSSGPGGQHANVTASRVEAVFDVEASLAGLDDFAAERRRSSAPAFDRDRRGPGTP